MTMSFNESSAGVSIPLTHIEIDNSQAVTGTAPALTQVLMLGHAATLESRSGAPDAKAAPAAAAGPSAV